MMQCHYHIGQPFRFVVEFHSRISTNNVFSLNFRTFMLQSKLFFENIFRKFLPLIGMCQSCRVVPVNLHSLIGGLSLKPQYDWLRTRIGVCVYWFVCNCGRLKSKLLWSQVDVICNSIMETARSTLRFEETAGKITCLVTQPDDNCIYLQLRDDAKGQDLLDTVRLWISTFFSKVQSPISSFFCLFSRK